MKNPLPWIAGVCVMVLVLLMLRPSAAGQAREPDGGAADAAGPIGSACVVTLDPYRDRETPGAGARRDGTVRSGIEAGDIVTGTLVRSDEQWVVLRDGTYENWIPRDKVLLIRASR